MEQKAQLKNLRAELRALRLQRAATLFEARAKKANLKAIKDSLVTKGIQSGTQTRKSGKKVVTPFKAKLGGLPGLWLVSIIATLAYKIPILNTITKRFFLWYGKSTWLEAIVLFRKYFTTISAIMFIWATLTTVGFGPYNILAGVYGIGPEWLTMFSCTMESMFNFFSKLSERLINYVTGGGTSPSNPSNLKSVSKNGWEILTNPFPKTKDVVDTEEVVKGSLRSIYKLKSEVSEPETGFFSWIANHKTAVFVTFFALGALVIFSYHGLFDGLKFGDKTDFEEEVFKKSRRVLSSVVQDAFSNLGQTLKNTINPKNWFRTADTRAVAFDNFINYNTEAQNVDLKSYPWTMHHPSDSISTKWYKLILGENTEMKKTRLSHLHKACDSLNLEIKPDGTIVRKIIPNSPVHASGPNATEVLNNYDNIRSAIAPSDPSTPVQRTRPLVGLNRESLSVATNLGLPTSSAHQTPVEFAANGVNDLRGARQMSDLAALNVPTSEFLSEMSPEKAVFQTLASSSSTSHADSILDVVRSGASAKPGGAFISGETVFDVNEEATSLATSNAVASTSSAVQSPPSGGDTTILPPENVEVDQTFVSNSNQPNDNQPEASGSNSNESNHPDNRSKGGKHSDNRSKGGSHSNNGSKGE